MMTNGERDGWIFLSYPHTNNGTYVRNILAIKLSRFAEIYTFLAPAPVALVLEDGLIMQRHHRCDIICDHVCHYVRSCMTSHRKTFYYTSKLYIMNRKFKLFS